MPDSRTVLPAPKRLKLLGVRATETAITLLARTSSRLARCPVCGKRSRRVHSRYTRKLADLPWQGVPVTVHLHVRRFFCDRPACERKIFAERVPGVAARYGGRRTERLDDWFTHISFALGGQAGGRLLKDLGVVVSGDTLLHHIRSLHLRDHKTPRILSVDDFAFRRGTHFGTVLVDLERHTLVDVLPDRSADTFAHWLGEHPGVEIVSRDRGGEYAEATRRAAPHAVQVADRFHLLKNLRDVVLRVFKQHREVLELVPTPSVHFQRLTNLRLDRKTAKENVPENRRTSFSAPFSCTLKERHEERPDLPNPRDTPPYRGEVLGLQDSAPKTALHKEGQRHRTLRGLHLKAVERRLSQRHADTQGDSRAGLSRGLPERRADHPLSLKEQEVLGEPLPAVSPGISAAQAAGILLKRPENCSEEELRTLGRLKTIHQVTKRCCTLFEEFAEMLRDKEHRSEERARSRLNEWAERAKASGVPELKGFAAKLLQDIEAVVAAMILPYSQGQTEGRVNKLKFIKRSMYGRGKFDLLRQRVLYASVA